MIQFDCDYCEGAHPLIMELLMATNMEQTALYGTDIYCDKAKEAIKRAIYSGGCWRHNVIRSRASTPMPGRGLEPAD